MSATAHSRRSIAADLERDRLRHRALRIEHVVAALRDRAIYREAVGDGVPAPLREAIAGFERELGDIRRRLAHA